MDPWYYWLVGVFVNSTLSNLDSFKVSTQVTIVLEPVSIGVEVQRNTDGDTLSSTVRVECCPTIMLLWHNMLVYLKEAP